MIFIFLNQDLCYRPSSKKSCIFQNWWSQARFFQQEKIARGNLGKVRRYLFSWLQYGYAKEMFFQQQYFDKNLFFA